MTYAIVNADNRHVLAAMPENSVDAVVTDPPYELGFMGKRWDASGIAFDVDLWRAVLRVLKPGGHLLAFSGTRTYHRMVCAIEDAGFEIRDQLAWMFGTGFPKSLDVSKAIDKDAGYWRGRAGAVVSGNGSMSAPNYERTPKGDPVTAAAAAAWTGWGTALKPAHEPIVLARKPLIGTVAANVLEWGTGGLAIDACRIGTEGGTVDRPDGCGTKTNEVYGTYGSCQTVRPTGLGRWPANVLLDEDAAAMLDAQSGTSTSGVQRVPKGRGGIWTTEAGAAPAGPQCGDTGGASRFFYTAKASKAEREAGLEHLPVRSGGELTDRVDGSDGLNSPRAGAGRGGGRRNHHPTVKPIALMRYLVRLITPPGGIVLDPFCGSGSTVVATVLEGFHAIGLELQPEYVEIARARVAHWEGTQR